MNEKQIIEKTKEYAEKFVDKVENGRARSRETYADMLELLTMIKLLENDNK